MRDCFMSKENRDREFFGMPPEERRKYRRRSERNLSLHPMYVDDYTEVTGRKLTVADKSLGNNMYRRSFSVLYFIEKKGSYL